MCHLHTFSRNEVGKGNKLRSRLNIFHYKVSYHYRDWGTLGCAMDLLVEGVTEGEISGIEAKFE